MRNKDILDYIRSLSVQDLRELEDQVAREDAEGFSMVFPDSAFLKCACAIKVDGFCKDCGGRGFV